MPKEKEMSIISSKFKVIITNPKLHYKKKKNSKERQCSKTQTQNNTVTVRSYTYYFTSKCNSAWINLILNSNPLHGKERKG